MSRPKKNKFDFKSLVIGVVVGVILTQAFSFLTSRQADEFFLADYVGDIKENVESAAKQAVPDVVKDVVPEVAPAPKPAGEVLGRIAIVIDDWGYTKRNCHFMKEIAAPFAVAILPNLAHTSDIAACAKKYGKQIMLHLPMEPTRTFDHYPNDYLLKTTMGEEKIRDILKTVLDRMPWVDGVNNHMGSKATSDPRIMEIVLDELKKRNLYFVDSLVTNKSVAEEFAIDKQVPFVKRDVFLDNLNRRSAIEAEFRKAADIARRKGSAVLIGHDRPLTMQIVKEQTRALTEQGFEIVSIEELLQ